MSRRERMFWYYALNTALVVGFAALVLGLGWSIVDAKQAFWENEYHLIAPQTWVCTPAE